MPYQIMQQKTVYVLVDVATNCEIYASGNLSQVLKKMEELLTSKADWITASPGNLVSTIAKEPSKQARLLTCSCSSCWRCAWCGCGGVGWGVCDCGCVVDDDVVRIRAHGVAACNGLVNLDLLLLGRGWRRHTVILALLIGWGHQEQLVLLSGLVDSQVCVV